MDTPTRRSFQAKKTCFPRSHGNIAAQLDGSAYKLFEISKLGRTDTFRRFALGKHPTRAAHRIDNAIDKAISRTVELS
jgi:hypothetical protein